MPEGFWVGPLFIRFYGIIIMLGAVAAAFLAEREVRRRGHNPELVWDGLIWVLIGGIVGARIWHIFAPQPSQILYQNKDTWFYLTHPLDAIAIWEGGLGIPGAIIGGALALYWFSRRRKLNFLEWADIAAPAVALGQAIGRWGNFFNQELYGLPTNLPWGIYIQPQYRVPPYTEFERFHPLFLYESLWNFLNMGVLLWLGRRYRDRLKNGDIFLIYLIIYPVGRFFLEFIRVDSAQVAGININQWVALVVALLSGILLFLHHRKAAKPSDTESRVEADDPAATAD